VATSNPTAFSTTLTDATSRKLVLTPGGMALRGPSAADTTLLKALARAFRWRRMLERHVSTANNRAVALTASGEAVFPGNPLQVGVNGIALSPDGETLYWGLTTGNGIFSAPAALLREPGTSPAALAAAVVGIAAPGGIDGVTVDARGRIYVVGITAGAVLRIDLRSGAVERLTAPTGTVWPDSLGWTPDSVLLFTVNQLNRVFGGTASFASGSGTFSVWRIPARQIAAASAT